MSDDPTAPADLPAPGPDAEPSEATAAEASSEPTPDSTATSVRRRIGPRGRLGLRWAGRLAVALVGVVLGVLLGGHTTDEIGPLTVSADLTFSSAATHVVIPPLGAIEVDAYHGPVGVDLTVLRVDQEKATAIVNGQLTLDDLTASVASDLKSAVVWLVLKTTIFALLGAAVLSVVVYRRRRATLVCSGLAVALVAGTIGLGVATFDSKRLETPTYTGLLAQAPALIGDVDDLATRFADYRKSLVKLITNVSKLYGTVSTLPTDPSSQNVIRVLHVSDIHLNPAGLDLAKNLVKEFGVDLVIDTGDLNDWGTEPEGQFTSGVGAIGVPYVFIRGNHDSVSTAAAVAAQPNAVVLDDSVATVAGLRIAGIGDPRFTPDKETGDDSATVDTVEGAGTALAKTIEDQSLPVDVALVHDPVSAKPLANKVPLVLAGHTHKRSVSSLSADTLLMVEGSTGGAGLRGLESKTPTPLEASVLYFDRSTKTLQAWDEVTVGGLGQTDVSIQRKLAPKAEAAAEESAASITPDPSPAGPDTSTAPAPAPDPAAPPSAATPGGARQPQFRVCCRVPV